jgi:hypothetical protein
VPAKKKSVAKDKPASSPDKDLLVRVRDRYKVMTEADKDNRTKALADLKFLHIPGEQWDKSQKDERGNRPCYEFNKLGVTAKRIVNDMRANRPQGKVRAVEDGDKDTADVLEGLIRNIWNVSDADTVIDYAAGYQVGGGMGAWRVETKYSDDTVFEQDIAISPIKNPFCLYADPAASDPIKRDAEDWILTERISKKSYESRWPNAKRVNFEGDAEHDSKDEDWQDDETVRICEYWYKEPATKTLCLLSDGKTIDKDALTPEQAAGFAQQNIQVVRERVVNCHKIMMCIVSGDAVLEKPTEWAGSEFPFIQVYGEWLVIDGKTYWHGITRFAKDAQRSYNVSRTAITETIALAPQAKWWATAEQVKGHDKNWAIAHKENLPFMVYNPDAKAPGPPARMGGADVPVALIQESQIASEEIKAVTGIFDSSLGNQTNETSGRAIAARQRQGEIATFNYSDNMAKGIRRTYEIIVGLIPKVYDTARSVRILGVDGAEKYVKINGQEMDDATGQTKPVNDVSRGKYDVTVTVGPSFATQRQEASETYMQLMQSFPQAMGVAGDLIFKSMDLPYAEQIAERLQTLLPPPIQKQIAEGKPLPPEAQAAMAQAAQAMEQVQLQAQAMQEASQEIEKGQSDIVKGKAEIGKLISQLEIKQAQFGEEVAKSLAQLTIKEAALNAREMQAKSEADKQALDGERQQFAQDSQTTAANIQQLAEAFASQAQELMAGVSQQQQSLSQSVDMAISALMNSGQPQGPPPGP